MNPNLRERLLPRLFGDFEFRERSNFLRQGRCPGCGKKELYAPAEAPWVLRCGRLNKCGAEFHIKDLYPDLFDDWSKRFPQTPKNPNAAADAYLADGRGFDLAKIKGCYTQESFYSDKIKAGTATVRFQLAPGVWWERLIDRPERFGSQKANFRGGYKGLWWSQKPLQGEAIPDELWIVEGIFDAIALMHHGIAAVAAMSSNNYPDVALDALRKACESASRPLPRLIWALDGDEAGRAFAQKHLARCQKGPWEATIASIPCPRGQKKRDWNDLHLSRELDEKHIAEWRYQGTLLCARNVRDKAVAMFAHDGKKMQFDVDFGDRLYWFKLEWSEWRKLVNALQDEGKEEKEAEAEAARRTARVDEICDCLPTPLFYMRDAVTDSAWYRLRVDFPHNGKPMKDDFTAKHLSAAAEFKARLRHCFPGASWRGSSAQLDDIMQRQLYNIKTVATIDYIGYCPDEKVYVYNDIAAANGKLIEVNEDDYFEIGKLSIRSLAKTKTLDLNPDLADYQSDWLSRFTLCFGDKGIIALAYWLGSLFAEQIRDRFESFPFLEIVGEPGAGKTTLLEFLWKLMGRSGYEGFDPMKASAIGFLRSMAQFSNLPVVLIEADRDYSGDGSKGRARSQFHWDQLKSLYNGGSLRTTGVKSHGNDTYDPQFRGAMVISQNAAVAASDAIMERIVHLTFTKAHQTPKGREAALELGRLSSKTLSGFLLKALTLENRIMDSLPEKTQGYEKELAQHGVKNQRIQKNYAQVAALLDALPLLCPLAEYQLATARAHLFMLAKEREQELQADHPIVEQFWEAYEYLNGMGVDSEGPGDAPCQPRLNHSRDAGLIAVNLNHFIQLASDMRQPVPDLSDLKKYLKTSRRPKFVESNRVICSAINEQHNRQYDTPRPTSIRCWIFQKERSQK